MIALGADWVGIAVARLQQSQLIAQLHNRELVIAMIAAKIVPDL
jgi:hypothetical protein